MKKILLLTVILLSGCALFDPEPPTEFKTGSETFEPHGCYEMRARDPKADC